MPAMICHVLRALQMDTSGVVKKEAIFVVGQPQENN